MRQRLSSKFSKGFEGDRHDRSNREKDRFAVRRWQNCREMQEACEFAPAPLAGLIDTADRIERQTAAYEGGFGPRKDGVCLKWSGPGSNRRHMDFQSIALPTELPDQSMHEM
jgi:hypothetical protein